MKLISLILSLSFVLMLLTGCTSTTLNANAEADKETTSKIEERFSTFKNYFRFHTSKQHQEQQHAFEEALFQVREQKAREKAAAKGAKENAAINKNEGTTVAVKEEPITP